MSVDTMWLEVTTRFLFQEFGRGQRDVQREMRRSRQVTRELLQETRMAVQSIGSLNASVAQSARSFIGAMGQMHGRLITLQMDMSKLASTTAKPRIELADDASSKVEDLMGLINKVGKITAGITVDGVISEVKDVNVERMRYKALGKKDEDMDALNQRAVTMTHDNPNMHRAGAMSLISKSEALNGTVVGGKYAEQATKLAITTGYTPEEHINMMTALRKSTNVDDPVRLANSIQYMNNNMKDLKGDFVNGIVQYSTQFGKLLDAPEKVAMLTGEMAKLDIWSDSASFEALRESVLTLGNQNGLADLLQTKYVAEGMDAGAAAKKAAKESETMQNRLSSGSIADQQLAMGQLMLSIATMQDKQAQAQMLNQLGGGAGKYLGDDFVRLLDVSGKVATNQIRPDVNQNEAENAYEAAKKDNSLFAFQQAQNDAKQAFLDLGIVVARDVTPVLAKLSEAAKGFAKLLSGMPDWARYAAELGVALLALKKWTSFLRGGKTKEAGKAKCIVKCTAKCTSKGNGKRGGNPKRSWLNPKTWGGEKDKKADQNRRTAERSRQNTRGGGKAQDPTQNRLGRTPQNPTRNGFGGKLQDLTKTSLGSKTGQLLNKSAGWLGKTVQQGTKGLLRKVPVVGTLMGVGQILTAKDKLSTAGKVGSEALGGWGGAAAGAAAGALIGSVVPVIGTAIGGAVGGIIGGMGGSMLGGALFDKAQEWWKKEEPAKPVMSAKRPLSKKMRASMPQSLPMGPPVPPVPVTATPDEKPKVISVTIPQITVPLHAEGVLQDIPTMLQMLRDPLVGSKIKEIIEKALLDALETRGGVPT